MEALVIIGVLLEPPKSGDTPDGTAAKPRADFGGYGGGGGGGGDGCCFAGKTVEVAIEARFTAFLLLR